MFRVESGRWEQMAAGCITQIGVTSLGIVAIGPGVSAGADRSWSTQRAVLISSDGENWDAVALHERLGFDYPDQLGVPEAVFAPPEDRAVTVLFTRAAEGESRLATLLTTTDGETWELVEGAEIFDNTDIGAVMPGGEGLIAVGASPGGEFVPTAAVFTSPDGASWRRVTPTTADFEHKIMTDVIATPHGFVAVGGDFFETGLMTAWTSPDGLSWTRSPHPDETLDPSVAQMTAHRITSLDGVLWASGEDHDASRSVSSLSALWKSEDGGRTWQRVADDVSVPFVLFDDGRVRIATTADRDVLLIQD
ncbi:MAG: exo-alpha-sialidase [Acidimicrobiia bacterium]|nr:exo-alpha-sialidase [Acidimicrobiia bacterium]